MAGEDFQEELARRRVLELAARRILRVPTTAGPEEIRGAFRRRAAELHPDRHRDDPQATLNFKRLVAACRLLLDGTEPSIPLRDSSEQQDTPPAGKYQRTSWGYYAWWQESFMENELKEEDG